MLVSDVYKRQLHNSVKFLNHLRLGQTLEAARISAAVTRTVIRIGAMHAGIPPVVNDLSLIHI